MVKLEEKYRNSTCAELKASDGSAKIVIYTYGYQYPEATNKWDGDWYMNYILLVINGVTAEIDKPIIEGRVLTYLLNELTRFKKFEISDVFSSFTEPEFSFFLSNDLLIDKSILVSGELIEYKVNTNKVKVKFEFKTNLDLLEEFIIGIQQILQVFPSKY
ncbi:WapI family immunity protein [Clostridium folliculivorans]|uniref:Uncharacterized protein n=1 Tax=Clostridium folliculivorans TaxID=2886038 RepID=A0A9W5Y6D6_9CLOT|nr:hypothetical protein [Clostridium folliculivorans]GKU27493.1 hypothetical protein CFOLD11_43200 [Clostridium folliculivorans]GKU32343.1 hypothetical protein CFB3_44510 [Clostridium folliculivorans]